MSGSTTTAPLDEEALAARFRRVMERIDRACTAVGRAPGSVRLVAVSKYHPAAAMRVLHGLGQREFGENYVQDLVHKRELLADLPGLTLRMIGHLQRNKTRFVARAGTTVDTVDSMALGEALSKRAASEEVRLQVLVQVNIGEEPQKAGVSPADLPPLLRGLRDLPHLRVAGLLAIPPDTAGHPEQARPYFRHLAALARQHDLAELSMGMSDDLEVAIEEGATMVRIGTAIFGPRPAAPSMPAKYAGR